MDNKTFKFSTTIEVRIGDINYGNHMSNESFIQFFQEARLRYLAQFNFSEVNLNDSTGIILTEVFCELKAEAFYGDSLTVFVRVSEMKKARFRMEYEIFREKDQKVIAKGYTIKAAFDYQKRKPVALPLYFKEIIGNYEKLVF
ncbi:MAG: acyl-CoA thioesterase [Spirochaetota bacterium]|nr:acyl-CoA thioesterase [Spirochaetota bacterium]